MKGFNVFMLLLFFGGVLSCFPVSAGNGEDLPVKVVLFPFREVILSARVDGVVASTEKRNGESFKAGELLLRLDDRRCRNELMKADAALAEAKTAAEFSKKVMEDNRRLFRDGMQSELEMSRKELDAAVTESRKTIAEANREEAAMQLNYCTLKAPFDGRIERWAAREFESVRNGQPLLAVIDDNQLLGVMNLPSDRLATTRIGDQLRIRVKENGTVVSGSIFEIAGRADHRSETFEVKIQIDNTAKTLTAGMTGILLGRESDHAD